VDPETTMASVQHRSERNTTLEGSLAFAFGLLLSLLEPLFLLLMGKDLVDAVWPHAVRSLEWTMVLRSAPSLALMLMLLSAGLAWALRHAAVHHPSLERRIHVGLNVALGTVMGFLALHLLMDVFYLRGAFLLLPTLMGWVLACLLVARAGAPTWRSLDSSAFSWTRFVHLLGVFFAAWLVMPGVPAVVGLAPSPPDTPALGYGSTPGPYDTVQFQFPYTMPDAVVKVQGPLENDVEFSVYVTLPVLPPDSPVTHLPMAVLLHGFGYPDVNAYQAWITHLSAKGMAVAFIQYPSDLRPDGHDSLEEIDELGMSNFLQHVYRNIALREALAHLNEVLLSDDRAPEVEARLGNVVVDPATLWAGGHSLGAAYTFLVLDEALSLGWGNHALVVALEAPASRPVQDALQPRLENLPNETLVQIAVAQDDMSVGMCPGVFHQQQFSGIPTERNQLIEIQSDKYGFPRLVASHYLQTDPAHDTLSDWSFYRRIDAQADFLVAKARNDTFTANWAFQYLADEATLTNMGAWSDGTPVLPLKLHHNALDNAAFSSCA
jgi:hypothetical protein